MVEPAREGEYRLLGTEPVYEGRVITLVKDTRRTVVRSGAEEGDTPALVAVDRPAPPFFRAVMARVKRGAEEVALPPATLSLLQVTAGETVAVTPLPGEG